MFGGVYEWFAREDFDKRVEACCSFLGKLGIRDEGAIFHLISAVIQLYIGEEQTTDEAVSEPFPSTAFKDELKESLLRVWLDYGDDKTRLYSYAKSHWLITWDFVEQQWSVTGLGRFFLDLTPIQAAIFLLTIDVSYSSGDTKRRLGGPERVAEFISADELRELQRQFDIGQDFRGFDPIVARLIELGLIKQTEEWSDGGGVVSWEPTPFGKVVVQRTLSSDNPFSDIFTSLIELEQFGDRYTGASVEADSTVQLAAVHKMVDNNNQDSIRTGVSLFKARKYLDSLKILFPSMEAIVNNMVIADGKEPKDFKGLRNKIEWLEKNRRIPPDFSNAIEIFNSRNGVVHGNIVPPDDYVQPLSLLLFRYMNRLLKEYRDAEHTDVTDGWM